MIRIHKSTRLNDNPCKSVVADRSKNLILQVQRFESRYEQVGLKSEKREITATRKRFIPSNYHR